jgi:death on curing protein
MTPRFLTLDEVMDIHHDQIARLLQSALAMPEAGLGDQYVHQDVFEMAAAFLFHLTSNHPFIDGNKRVGAMAVFIFLKLNGLALVAEEPEFERVVLSIATAQ